MSDYNSTYSATSVKKPIRVLRADRHNSYFSMSRKTAQDTTLSFEARGMLAYLLSKPDDWEVRPKDLQQLCGRDKVYRILKELAEHRYIEQFQIIDEKTKFRGFEYRVHETPFPEKPEADTQKPETPTPAKEIDNVIPFPEKPYPGNQDTTYKREEQNTESNTDSADGEKTPPPDVKENPPDPPKQIQEPPKKPPSLFDVIALEVFGLEKVNGDGAKIGAFLKNLLNTCLKYNTPEEKAIYLRDLTEMYKWWQQTHFDNAGNQLHKPVHVETICRALQAYRESPRYKDLRATEKLINGH